MIKRVFTKQKKALIQYTLLIFILFSLILFFTTSLLQYKLNESKKNDLLTSEQKLINVESKTVTNKINRITSDLLFISDCLRMYDKGNGDYSEVAKLWMAFSNRKKNYDQIRFIDVDGNEVIRVNHQEGGSVLVDKTELQNKKDRYYFADTIKLEKNQIYISKLDLNKENNIIDDPIKPMLRVSMPYYDQNGTLKGITILNYSANDMFEKVKDVTLVSNGDIFMLNEDGYWLYDSKNSSNEWSFMYEDKLDNSFANNYPDDWKAIQKNKNGYHISRQGVFVYSNIITNQVFAIENSDYSLVLGSGDWMLVSYISPDTKYGALITESFGVMLLDIALNNHMLYILILIIAIIMAVLISNNKNAKERMKYFSEYDVMTGVYNRRAGIKKLSQIHKNMSKNECQISICFVDINGLKEVNDALGHEAGDELILSVINAIKKSIRSNDFVARLGGDEFLIIFEGLNESTSEEIWKRVVEEYTSINEKENRKYVISASHGIETFECDSIEYIDAIVNRADEKMYDEKRRIKKDLKVLRNL